MSSKTNISSDVLLQAFNWNSWRHHNKRFYRFLQTKSKNIRDSGIAGVWLPPPTKSVSPQGYMPLNLYDLNSEYGTQDDLIACIDSLHNDEIDVYGDLVINHRCAEFQNQDGIYNVFGGKLAWDATAIVSDDTRFAGKGNPSNGVLFHAAPNIDHSQLFVREDLINWMKWLRSTIGYDGFRFDFVAGFDGKYVAEYFNESNPNIIIGEYWDSMDYYDDGSLLYNQNSHRQRIINWMDNTNKNAHSFDMTTKGILQEALAKKEFWRLRDQDGKPPGVLGWWSGKTVTFLDNHDTHCDSQNHWSFPNQHVLEGYAYLLTHSGLPMIYWDHFVSPIFAEDIKALIRIRKEYNITNISTIDILEATSERYVAKIDNKLVITIGNLDIDTSKSIFTHNTINIKIV